MTVDSVTPLDAAAEAWAIAQAVSTQQTTAQAVVAAALERIKTQDSRLNAFTEVLAERALVDAAAVDGAIAAGEQSGPLAGVPFAVKNLFDIDGVVTLAGSKINRENSPARQDAAGVAALKQAGAILIGALNMDEYAYGFVTENSHYGDTHNPHDLTRMAGGSSGGSAAAVAGGLVPLTLGSDTNGSIRVPASMCGIFGLKPTYGRLSRAGAALFAASFDHVGPFARSVRDITLSFDAMQGYDPRDPVCTQRLPEPCTPLLALGSEGLRIAVADGHFATGGQPEVFAAVEQVAKALGASQTVTIPEAHRARAAAYVITNSEGSNLHLENLKRRPQDFDPATRDRFLSGALIPSSWYVQAQRFRRWYRDQVRSLFETVDLILAPTLPCVAPLLGQQTMDIDGAKVLMRPNLGLYTQPLSFIGLPILSVPVQQPNGLPVGVQLIAAPYQEATILRAAAALEAAGVVGVKRELLR
ncbi:MAG: AtzE family amidohydrolase [Kaiparowitsia implicata GSE-PSE-MK54-09C]|jgi:AtzE family amidohydrolase|nr:AtzE family amidohydrolase [Kaiparowitsia implicata GSE-PSE-MK54-09C]